MVNLGPRNLELFPQSLELDGIVYNFVQERKNSSAIYKYVGEDDSLFLKIGPEDVIQNELKQHRELEKKGFPVSRIIKEGRLNQFLYALEESLGEHHFGEIFTEEWSTRGAVSDSSFAAFIKASQRYFATQLQTGQSAYDLSAVMNSCHVDGLIAEERVKKRAGLVELLTKTKQRITSQLTGNLLVLTHYDFCPFNVLPKGVIDFEDLGIGPVGYDIVSAVCLCEWFPVGKQYEFELVYYLSPEQVKKYLSIFKDQIASHITRPVQEYFDTLYLLRGFWLAYGMDHVPNIQAFRFEKLEREVKLYLENKQIVCM